MAANSFVIPQKTIEKEAILALLIYYARFRDLPSAAPGQTTHKSEYGGEGNHTLILIDGVEARGGDGEYFLSGLTAANVERIEVLRGHRRYFMALARHRVLLTSSPNNPCAKIVPLFRLVPHKHWRYNFAKVAWHRHKPVTVEEKDTGYDFSGSDGEKDTIERDSLYLATNMTTDNGFEIGMDARYAEEHYKYDATNSSATSPSEYVTDDTDLFADRDEGGLAISTSWHTAEQRPAIR